MTKWVATFDREGRFDFTANNSLTIKPTVAFGLTCIFEGNLFETRELCGTLGISDQKDAAEIILHAYKKWGPEFPAKLSGQFVFVIFDSLESILLFGRDKVGIIPLFIARLPRDKIAISIDPQSLLGLAELDPSLNRVVLAEYLFDFWNDVTETPWLNIERVLPAHTYRFAGTTRSKIRYWEPRHADLRRTRGSDAYEKFVELLTKAVRRRLVPNKSGLFLSGGIDSISVASVAAEELRRHNHNPLTALSILFPGSDSQEGLVQQRVVENLNLDSRFLSIDEAAGNRSLTAAMLELNRQWPVPLANSYMAGFVGLARQGKQAGCDVILTGGGGDEWLGVSPYLSADLMSQFRFLDLTRFVERIARCYDLPQGGMLKSLLWTFGLRPILKTWRSRVFDLFGYEESASRAWRRIPNWSAPDPDLKRTICERIRAKLEMERHEIKAAKTYYDFESRRAFHHPVVLTEVENKFYMGEAAGVRISEPYWDADLIDALYEMNPEDLSLGNAAKGLSYELVNRQNPSLIDFRIKKIALFGYYKSRISEESRQIWKDDFKPGRLAELGLIDPTMFGRVVEAALSGDSNKLWLVNFALAHEAWIDANLR